MLNRKPGSEAASNLLNYHLEIIRTKSLDLSKKGIAEYSMPLRTVTCNTGMLKTMLILDKYQVQLTETELKISWK